MHLPPRPRNCALIGLFIFGLLAQFSAATLLTAVSLEWDPNPEPDIAGYVVHYGTASGNYTQSLEVGSTPEATLAELEPGTTYFCVVRAFNTSGISGRNSLEISFSAPETGLPGVGPVVISGGENDTFSGDSTLIRFGNADLGTLGITKTFRIKNPGAALLAGLNVTADGATFSITAPAASTLASGETAEFSVTFKPLTAGSHTGVIRIQGNETGDVFYQINVQGSGVVASNFPAMAVTHADGTKLTGDPAAVDLGTVTIGATGSVKIFTIHNTGTAELTGLEIATEGADTADFTVGPLQATSLAPGDNTSFEIAFQPGSAGFRSANLHIASNETQQSPVAIALSGSGINIPILSLEDAESIPVDTEAVTSFGSAKVGSTGRTLTYIVRNTGTARLTGLRVATGGTHAAAFLLGGQPATSLEPGAFTRFTLAFRPTLAGAQSGTLEVTSISTGDVIQRIDLYGIGVPVPEITVSLGAGTLTSGRSSVDFGNCLVGSTSLARTLTIKNSGSAPLTGLSLAGESSVFPRSSLATTTLAPGASTTFKVFFRPATADPHSDQLAISSNDSDERLFMIDLTGEGLDAPEIVITLADGRELMDESAFVNLGKVEVGSTSRGQVLTIYNSGTANLASLSLVMDGLNPGDFTVSALRTTKLGPEGSTSFKVNFSPTRAGTRWAALRVTSNDGNERVFDIFLTGTGEYSEETATPRMQAMSAPGRIESGSGHSQPPVRRIEMIGGRKYLTLTFVRTSAKPVSQRDIEVSSDLVNWASGRKHTKVLIDNERTLKVRDNTPLARNAKRYIRLKPNR